MLLRDVMTTNVVSAPPDMSIYEARKIMQAHRIRRLPVAEKGKLLGMVSMGRLESISPPKATAVSLWELNYLLAHTTLREIMEKNLITASPDMTVEEGVALAQRNKVGALLVVENGNLVGVITTNDFFYRIVNPVLGLGKAGSRLFIPGAGEGKALEDVLATINSNNIRIVTLFPITRDDGKPNDLVVHLATEDVSQIIRDLKDRNYLPTMRRR